MELKASSVRSRSIGYAVFIGALVVIFRPWLSDLCAYAMQRNLYSHIFLVPLVSIYLLYIKRPFLRTEPFRPGRRMAVIWAFAGGAALILYASLIHRGYVVNMTDTLALTLFSFVCFVLAGFLFFFGEPTFRSLAFPLLFLLFLIPLPALVEHGVETFFQVSSAYCYAGLLYLTGTPFFRDGLVFRMPGLNLHVAAECSGIRSSLVLFITSLLAGHLFLATRWRKTVMALLFVPIAILRNAVRILTITLLTLHVDPTIIEGPVHHRGGPPFFVLSLIPLFLALFWLRRTETKKGLA